MLQCSFYFFNTKHHMYFEKQQFKRQHIIWDEYSYSIFNMYLCLHQNSVKITSWK